MTQLPGTRSEANLAHCLSNTVNTSSVHAAKGVRWPSDNEELAAWRDQNTLGMQVMHGVCSAAARCGTHMAALLAACAWAPLCKTAAGATAAAREVGHKIQLVAVTRSSEWPQELMITLCGEFKACM